MVPKIYCILEFLKDTNAWPLLPDVLISLIKGAVWTSVLLSSPMISMCKKVWESQPEALLSFLRKYCEPDLNFVCINFKGEKREASGKQLQLETIMAPLCHLDSQEQEPHWSDQGFNCKMTIAAFTY